MVWGGIKWNDGKDWREKGKRGNWVFVTFGKYFILTKRILEGTYKCQLWHVKTDIWSEKVNGHSNKMSLISE